MRVTRYFQALRSRRGAGQEVRFEPIGSSRSVLRRWSLVCSSAGTDARRKGQAPVDWVGGIDLGIWRLRSPPPS